MPKAPKLSSPDKYPSVFLRFDAMPRHTPASEGAPPVVPELPELVEPPPVELDVRPAAELVPVEAPAVVPLPGEVVVVVEPAAELVS